MNTEKFKTALDVFLDGMRAFVPTTLGRRWPSDYVASLQPNNRQKWNAAIADGKQEKELIDFGNLEVFAKASFSFWEPFWGDDHEDLLDTLRLIRVARNETAHNTKVATEGTIDEAFAKMILMARKINQKAMETKLKTLQEAWNTAKKEDRQSMKLVWRKNIALYNAALFMQISYLEKREDMQQFLAAAAPRERLFEGPLAKTIAERVEKYFQSLEFLDNSGQLTASGKTVAQTAMYTTKEEGKYRIWYCQNDELLGNRILYLERERAGGIETGGKAQYGYLPFLRDQAQYWLSGNKDKEGRPFQIEYTGNQTLPETLMEDGKGQQKIVLRWEWNGAELAILHLDQGHVSHGKESIDFRQQELKLSIDLVHWLQALFPKWNFEAKRLEVAYDEKLSDDTKRSFLKSSTQSLKGFESIECTNVPVMPSNLIDAQKWRNWLAEKELERDYVTEEGYASILEGLNSKAAFALFQLDSPDPLAFLEAQFGARGAANRGAAFWHLAGCIDLNPNQSSSK
jgi:hypothetical protein